jgi:hypothetical protein
MGRIKKAAMNKVDTNNSLDNPHPEIILIADFHNNVSIASVRSGNLLFSQKEMFHCACLLAAKNIFLLVKKHDVDATLSSEQQPVDNSGITNPQKDRCPLSSCRL